jgi:hypothetical protein
MAIYQSGVELSDADIDQISSFLITLTGEYNGVPVTSNNSRDDIHGH